MICYNSYYEKVGNKVTDITDEIPFDLPDSWCWIRHNDIFEISGGSQPPKSQFITNPKDGYIRLYQIRDYGESPQPIYIPVETASKTTKKGDILLARYGASLGKVFYAEDGAYNVAMAKVIPLFDDAMIDKDYLYIFYKSSIYQKAISGNARSAQAGFNKEDLSSMFFPLPPLKEQHRIVTKLKNFNPLLDDYAKLDKEEQELVSSLPNELRKSILQYAIQGKLVPQDPNDEPASVLLERIRKEKELQPSKKSKKNTDSFIYKNSDDNSYYPFDIPETWIMSTIGEIAEVKGGKRIPAGRTLELNDNGYIYIRVTDMKDMTITSKTLRYVPKDIVPLIANYVINKDDLYLTIAGTIGSVGIVPDEFDGMNLTENAVKITNIKIDKDYLMWAVASQFIQDQFVDKTNQVAQPKLAINKILSAMLPIPPLREQERIVKAIKNSLFLLNSLIMRNKAN